MKKNLTLKTLEEFPLTQAQKRLWFLYKLNPESLFYNISLIYNLTGLIDYQILQSSFHLLLERHAILRAKFLEKDNKPIQVISNDIVDPLAIMDFSSYSPKNQEEAEESTLKQLLGQPFDLERDNLFRATLFILGKERHTLVFNIHHIITDMWSMDIICAELSTIYNDLLEKRDISLTSSPPQYINYAKKQLSDEYQKKQKEHKAFWLNQLKEPIPSTPLPFDRTKSSEHTYNGRIERITISKRTYQGFKNICRENNTTLFIGLLAAYNIFLHHITGQNKVVIGTFLANRNDIELEKMVGLLFNDLPVITVLRGSLSFLELLPQIKQNILNIMDHSDFSVEELSRIANDQHSAGRSPLYNVTFQLYFRNDNRLKFKDVQARQRRIFQGTKFDLMFYGSASQDSLDIWFNYNSDLFNSDTIQRFLHYFNTLLQSIVATPASSIMELDLLTSEEQHFLSIEVNKTTSQYPRGKAISELLEIQALNNPEKIALSDSRTSLPSHRWTYKEIKEKVDLLAGQLQKLGAKRGTVVGVLLPRGAGIALADIAVLKAGAICLLLDARYPSSRIEHMLNDAGASILITTRNIAHEFSSNRNINHIYFEDYESFSNTGTLQINNDPEDIAFVVYTSGSTGNPKGVMLSHRACISQVFHRINNLEILPSDTLCLSLSVAFSTLPMQLLVPLINGSTVIIYDDNTVTDPFNLFKQVDLDGVSLLEITVSTLSSYLRYIDLNPDQKPLLSKLKMVLTAGEKLQPHIVRHFYSHYPYIKLATTFGQSEATGIMANAIIPNDPNLTQVIEGYPSSNNRIYIFDQNLKLVPLGVSGNVYFAGDGLASGYINNPDATLIRFIPDPFVKNKFMVNTGDIARRLPDGRIEVLGRTDMMVKIRGNRVELIEVEKYLQLFPEVNSCVVVARDDHDGSKELVAYYTSQQIISTHHLQQHLQQFLPTYMIPNKIVRIGELPLNPNKKIDRLALPAPETLMEEIFEADTALNDLEQILLAICCEILGLEQNKININANFFELGGHSLKAMELIARIHKEFNLIISLKEIFTHPSLREIAHLLEVKSNEK